MRPRVLLIEDDPTIRRLVSLALEDEPIDLVCCEEGQAGLLEMAREPVVLVLSDLMMSGMDGLSFFAHLQSQPQVRRGARLVAFSAGLTAERREQLTPLGVDGFLAKPVSMATLLDLVRDAVQSQRRGPGTPDPAQGEPESDPTVVSASVRALTERERAEWVEAEFLGDAALYASFRATCITQYPSDVEAMEQALRDADLAAVRRLAHNFKGSLRSLGEERLAAGAGAMEAAATRGDSWAQLTAQWASWSPVLALLR